MKKYLQGEFSSEKLRKVEGRINCYYSRARTDRLTLFIIACVYCLIQGVGYSLSIRYVGDFYEGISFDRFIILKDIQNLLDGWFFKCYGILNLLFPILVMVGVSIVSYLAVSLVTVVLNLIKKLLFTGMSARRIPDKNQVKKIKKLIVRTSKIRKICDPDMPFSVVVIFSYLIATAYPVYSVVEYQSGSISDNILPILIIAGMSLVVLAIFGTIPLMISFSGVTSVNSSFPRKMSTKLYQIEKVLDNWWLELDPAEKIRRDKEKNDKPKWSDSYIATMAKVYARERKESIASGRGLYGSPGCGEAHIDTTDY